MADFRALCAELVESVEVLLVLRPAEARTLWTTEDRLTRARAALAEEPAVPAPPSDGEVAELVAWLRQEFVRNQQIGNRTSALQALRAAELLERLQELEGANG